MCLAFRWGGSSGERGPAQAGRPGEEDEGYLPHHAQEDGQEARQGLLLRGDGEPGHARV